MRIIKYLLDFIFNTRLRKLSWNDVTCILYVSFWYIGIQELSLVKLNLKTNTICTTASSSTSNVFSCLPFLFFSVSLQRCDIIWCVKKILSINQSDNKHFFWLSSLIFLLSWDNHVILSYIRHHEPTLWSCASHVELRLLEKKKCPDNLSRKNISAEKFWLKKTIPPPL